MGDFDLTVTMGDSRLAPDERRAENVPTDLQMGWTWQGGPKDLGCQLLRSTSYDGLERLYDAVTVYAPDGQVEWCGRNQQMPRSINGRMASQSPRAQGWATVGQDDNKARRALFIDRDLGRWVAPSADRMLQWIGAPFKPSVAAGQAGSLRFDVSGAWATAAGRPSCLAHYIASPLRVGYVGFSGVRQTGVGADWYGQTSSVDASGVSPSTIRGDWLTAAPGATSPAQLDAVGAAGVELAVYYPTAPITDADTTRWAEVQNLFVVGDHGIPLAGSGPADYGIKGSDAVRWLVETGWGAVRPGEIIDSGLPIPHLAFPDPQTDADIFNGINAYHGWAWGIWGEDLRFDWHPYGQGRSRRWIVSTDDEGVVLEQDGDDAASLFTRIVVSYRAASGETRTVGSPGTQCDEVDEAMMITDPTHPSLAAGVSPIYHLDMGVVSTSKAARAVGAMMLTQLNATRRAGRAVLTGYVTDEHGVREPVYRVKGGDEIVFTTIGDEEPRRVATASYNHAQRRTSVELDTQLQTVEAWVQHLGARGVAA